MRRDRDRSSGVVARMPLDRGTNPGRDLLDGFSAWRREQAPADVPGVQGRGMLGPDLFKVDAGPGATVNLTQRGIQDDRGLGVVLGDAGRQVPGASQAGMHDGLQRLSVQRGCGGPGLRFSSFRERNVQVSIDAARKGRRDGSVAEQVDSRRGRDHGSQASDRISRESRGERRIT